MAFSKVKHILNLFIAELRSRFGKKPDFAELSRGLSECSFPQAWGSTTLESDPAKLLPQFLNQLIALGQTAHQIRHALGGNGHRPEKISEVIQQPTEGGDHAH